VTQVVFPSVSPGTYNIAVKILFIPLFVVIGLQKCSILKAVQHLVPASYRVKGVMVICVRLRIITSQNAVLEFF